MMKVLVVLACLLSCPCIIALDIFGLIRGKSTPTEPVSDTPDLHWPTLEKSPGRVVSLQGGELEFAAEYLTENAKLDTSKLLMVEYPKAESTDDQEAAWKIVMKNGDSLLVDEVRPESEALKCIHLEQKVVTRVRWAEIAQVTQLKAKEVIYSGPTGLAGWDAPDYFPHRAGALVTRRWNKIAGMALTLPERCRIDFTIRSTEQPKFKLALFSATDDSPHVEVWNKEVVLVCHKGEDTRFLPLLTLNEKDREVKLTLCWDKPQQIVKVWSGDGALLGEIKQPISTTSLRPIEMNVTSKAGVYLTNLARNLVLEHLEVSEWDGNAPQVAKPVKSLGGRDGFFVVDDKETAPDDVRHLATQAEPLPLVPDKIEPYAVWLSGAFITSKVALMTASEVVLQPPWSLEPLKMMHAGLWRITFGQEAERGEVEKFAKMDVLELGKLKLHGVLEGGDGYKQPLWRLDGALQAVSLRDEAKDGDELRVLRAGEKDGVLEGGLAFLQSGEVVRAELQRLTEETVELDTGVAGHLRLKPDQVRAMRWVGGGLESNGFRDKAWQSSGDEKTEVKVKLGKEPGEDAVDLNGKGKFFHDRALSGADLCFRFSVPEGWGGLGVSLFLGSGKESLGGTYGVVIYRSSDTIYVVESDKLSQGVSNRQTLRGVTKPDLDVKLTFQDTTVQVYVDNTLLFTGQVPSSRIKGSGLAFSTSSLWGSSSRPVRVSAFRMESAVTNLPPVNVPERAKNEVLTVPRFRKDVLPQHVLVAANGDVVRGQIEEWGDQRVSFSSGLESMVIDRGFIQTLLWLQKPDAPSEEKPNTASAGIEPGHRWVLLKDGTRLQLDLQEFGKDKVKGISKELGLCEFPTQAVMALYGKKAPGVSTIEGYTKWKLNYAPEPVLPEPGTGSPLVGKPAPDFKLPLLYTEGDWSPADFRGKVVVLDFWATWCGPCAVSLPQIIEVVEEIGSDKVELVGVNRGEADAAVKRFIEQRNWKLKVALDSTEKVSRMYLVDGIPHTVVIDPNGKVTWVHLGVADSMKAKVKEAIEKALKGES
jgi:thiol-disulfide isomerase/thioredoxin